MEHEPETPPSTVVVKCGGSTTTDPARICADVAELAGRGSRVVLVHGGSGDIDRLTRVLGVPNRRLTAPDGVSTRYTDAATLEAFTLALCGATKPRLLAALGVAGLRPVGLTGLDAGLLRAQRKRAVRAVVEGRSVIVRDNHSGRLTGVDSALLSTLLDAGLLPVVSPPAIDADGAPVNVDADRAAAAVAAALGAEVLVLLTGADGVLADPADPDSRLAEVALAADGLPAAAEGGMKMKLAAAREALTAGVGRVLIGDGHAVRPVRRALAGESTRVVLAPGAGDGEVAATGPARGGADLLTDLRTDSR